MSKPVILFILLFFAISSFADEIRPAYLEVKEKSHNIFSAILKVPAKGDKKLNIHAQFPSDCKDTAPVSSYFIRGAYLERWSVKCENGLIGKTVSIKGLESTNTDLLLRLEFMNAASQSVLLTPAKYFYLVPEVASSFQIVKTYTLLGIEHILMGVDHLLFVFALLLIVKNMRRLVWTITAFTLAHSLTMAGATLGFAHLPQQPVEAIIALSILFLTMEIVHEKEGRAGIASAYPWIVAFIFGLVHGFGFAGALAEIGLPQQAITLALIFFNIGVEIGQLLFTVVVLILAVTLRKVRAVWPAWTHQLPVYSIGGISAFWLIERVAGF